MTNKEKQELQGIILAISKLIQASEDRAEKRLIKGYQDIERTYTTGERQLDQRLDCCTGQREAA
jgi:hypothetical protein